MSDAAEQARALFFRLHARHPMMKSDMDRYQVGEITAALQARERAAWIDVHDSLPEENSIVAVFYGAKEASGVDVGLLRDGQWLLKKLQIHDHDGIWKVLKWYPLPPWPEHWQFTFGLGASHEEGQ